MMRLHYSNRLEKLVVPLAALVRKEQARDPLARVTVVVPNRAVAEFLKLRLAECEGVAANLEFPFLRRYLAGQITDADPALRVLEADELELAVFECLRTALDAGEPETQAISTYISAAPSSAAQRELRLFQLSARVARLFREYSVVRRAMLARWPSGRALDEARAAETERWQRWLYLALFGRDGELRPEWLAGRRCRWLLLPDAFDAAGHEGLKAALPSQLHIFALSYAGPEFVRIFSRLAEQTELHVYALNPCLEFWEDVDTGGARFAGGRLVPRGRKVGGRPEMLEDPFGLQSGEDNLALRLWGRPGREYIRLLNELTDCDFDAHFERPPGGGALTLLERVQESILLRKPEGAPAGTSVSGDGSIRFLACPGIRREVEIAADTVWRLLIRKDEALDKAEPLRFHQIALLFPDQAGEAYLPHIEAVFGGRHEIPLNMVERRLGAGSRVAEAVELLLKLPLGEFTRDEMLRLLTHPEMTGGLDGADAEQWTEWCNSVGVYLGADARAFSETYVPPAMYHWDQALKRFALGFFMEGEPHGETRAFTDSSGIEYRPYETAQDAVSSIAALVRMARGLLADALEMRSRRLAAADWGRLMAAVVNAYVRPAEPAGERTRDAIVRALQSMASSELRSAPVPYEVACELALARIADAESACGRYTESGVVVGPLSALRSLPFRVIFVLGLGEAVFPERDRRDPLDLRQVRRQAGDVSPAERDRYLFLETLLAARERLFLSYVARNPVTGEELEPSVVVRELELILRSWLDGPALERMTVRHRLSPYDRRYFPELCSGDAAEDKLEESFDPNARRGARIAALRDDLEKWRGREPWRPAQGRLSLDQFRPEVRARLSASLRVAEPPARSGDDVSRVPEIVLPIVALRRFLECPLQGAARYALGMIDEDEAAADDSEDEPLAQDFLEHTMLLREAFWLGRAEPGQMERHYDALVRAAQLSGHAPCGPFADAARAAALEKLRFAAEQASAAGVKSLAGWRQVRIGGAEEFAQVDRILPAITLEVKVKRPERAAMLRVRLQGRVGPVSPELDTSIRCVAGSRAKTKDFLEGFIGAVALAAAGEKMPSTFTVLAVAGVRDRVGGKTGGRITRSFRLPSATEAREYLGRLAGDLLSGDNDYFMPVEAVERVLATGCKRDDALAEAIEDVRGNERERCSSDYGPIRDARRFGAPVPTCVRELIERRFGPITGIFGR